MTVEPFAAADALEMLGEMPADAARLEASSDSAITVRVDGKPVLCGGFIEITPAKALVWSFVGPDARRHAKAVHGVAKRFISTLAYRRVEATCRTGFVRGAAWLARLGFHYEGTMRSWGPNGADFDLYARVSE